MYIYIHACVYIGGGVGDDGSGDNSGGNDGGDNGGSVYISRQSYLVLSWLILKSCEI